LIRRKEGGEAFALTCPLVTKSDGSKFGKSESGNVWLDPEKTSPYSFYQFWLNVSDEDAEKYIKIFTTLPKNEINELTNQHREAPHMRLLQKKLAEQVTILTHGKEELDAAIEASSILFGKGTTETLKRMDEKTFLSVFEGVPRFNVKEDAILKGESIINLLTDEAAVFPSKGELRRLVSGGGLSINKEKVSDLEKAVNKSYLLNNRYILVQKGKKNYFLLVVENVDSE